MNNQELKSKIAQAVEEILYEKGFVAPVELLMKLNILTKQNYEAWRNGKVPYLEKVCTANLSKLSFIMSQLRGEANTRRLKPSFTAYNRWGKGPQTRLRFSKFGDPRIEAHYSTHFVKQVKVQET